MPTKVVTLVAFLLFSLLASHPASSESASFSASASTSTSTSFLAAAPGPDVVDGFWRSPTVRRDLERFERTCRPLMGERIDTWLKQYHTNKRVLTLEASCLHAGQNGLGNLLGDFLAWFVWGVVTDRAVYVRWTDCPDEDKKRRRMGKYGS